MKNMTLPASRPVQEAKHSLLELERISMGRK